MPGKIVWDGELQPQLRLPLGTCGHVSRVFERVRAGLTCRNIGLRGIIEAATENMYIASVIRSIRALINCFSAEDCNDGWDDKTD